MLVVGCKMDKDMVWVYVCMGMDDWVGWKEKEEKKRKRTQKGEKGSFLRLDLTKNFSQGGPDFVGLNHRQCVCDVSAYDVYHCGNNNQNNNPKEIAHACVCVCVPYHAMCHMVPRRCVCTCEKEKKWWQKREV